MKRILCSAMALAFTFTATTFALPLYPEFQETVSTNGEQADKVDYIAFGNFDQWITRNIKESAIIGGKTKTIYAIGPNKTINGNQAYSGMGGSPWATSNVMAHVKGIYKTNLSVYKEARAGHGYCAKLYTHLEECKVLGIINIKVLAAGSVFLGQMMEPITGASEPMKYLNCGRPFTKKPKAIMFDYKVQLSGSSSRIKQTGFGGASTVGGMDMADCIVLLQKRWEDAKGNIHAKRVGTMIKRFDRNSAWVNNAQFPILYGDITKNPRYFSAMALNAVNRYALNSKGKMVPIKEEGWASDDEAPTHLFIQFDSSHGGAYIGSVGNTLWIDNVRLVY